jgi:hypothetical protein
MNAQVKDSLGVAGRGPARRQARTSATGRRWPTRPRGLVPVHGGTLAPLRFRQRAAMP